MSLGLSDIDGVSPCGVPWATRDAQTTWHLGNAFLGIAIASLRQYILIQKNSSSQETPSGFFFKVCFLSFQTSDFLQVSEICLS
ncbi:hypothetical protein LWI28_029189 [Acer negundo]|uniref:Uncharacterized protein n=1 Tax=Acer negundo TaxID=4023 RepID=A0AAD5JMN2_ACENE|nr:hypothetical protein LWI28_029189 [Acer negundo]